MARRRFQFRRLKLHKHAERGAHLLLKSQLLAAFLALFVLGFWVGRHVQPEPVSGLSSELFDHVGVASYRETPHDSSARFVVELSSSGHVFRRYDIDARRFEAPIRGHEYRYSINSTRYRPLQVRGYVGHGFWLELPASQTENLSPDQYSELYRSTVDYLKPVSVASSVIGTLTGYSIGFRLATWSSSASNPVVQERWLESPHAGRIAAHEAWRRVLLEPVIMDDGNDAARFAAARGTQRIYTNFYKLALRDSDGFIPREAARLDSLGFGREAHAMRAFALAAQRAATDSCDLSSADFGAVEEWASLLDRFGTWAPDAIPKPGEERMRYLGTLEWYGIAPATTDERRLWVGPRVLVREGDSSGFIADDIPRTDAGCPVSWRAWLRSNHGMLESNVWIAQWMGAREFAPLVQWGHVWIGTLHIPHLAH